MSYQTLIFLPANTRATLDAAFKKLDQSPSFNTPGVSVKKTQDRVQVRSGLWSLRIALTSGPMVQEESSDIAERYATAREDRDMIRSCDTRFELYGDDDPEMEHCDDYILVVEHLTTAFKGVAFECHAEEFV